MSRLCGDIDLFTDEQMSAEDAERFRAHLVDCARCRRVLEAHLVLGALYRAHLVNCGSCQRIAEKILRPRGSGN